MLNITHYQRNANENHNNVPFHAGQNGCYPKVYKQLMLERVQRKRNPLTPWEYKLVQPLWRTMWRFLNNLEIELPYDPPILLLGIHTEGTRIERDMCTPMFITALFTIARTLKQPRCPSADEWIRKLWYICTMEYYSAIEKNAFDSVLTKWMRMHCLLTAFPQPPQGSPQLELSEHSSPACLTLQFQAGARVSMTEERLQH